VDKAIFNDMMDLSARMITRKYLLRAADCCRNRDEVLTAYLTGAPLPPLVLTTGLTIRHEPCDPAKYVFLEIFGADVYRRNGFYVPSSRHIVVDCGANIGLFAFQLANTAPGIQIHCFEPASAARQRLELNIQLNQLSKSINVYPFAIFPGVNTKNLRHAQSTGDHSFFDRSTTGRDGEERVECVSLQQALDMCGARQIDLLKIDAEGSEIEIVEGADIRTWERIDKVVVEFHDHFRPGCRDRVSQALRSRGFSRLWVDEAFPCSSSLGLIKASR
jgi:FkbM family methyltransferase